MPPAVALAALSGAPPRVGAGYCRRTGSGRAAVSVAYAYRKRCHLERTGLELKDGMATAQAPAGGDRARSALGGVAAIASRNVSRAPARERASVRVADDDRAAVGE